MKQTKNFRRLMSFILIVTMLLSVMVVGIASVASASTLAITYDYKYLNAGYAEGRVKLSGTSADYGTYYFYWADDTKALEGYAPITSLSLNQDSKSFNMGEFTAIPADATKLIAIKSATVPATKTVAAAAAVYDIPAEKQFKYSDSEKEYNFQTLSDIHFHKDNYNAYAYADEHFTSALNAAEDRGAAFVSTCGDNTNYCDQKEWGQYLSAIANSDFTGPVYEVNGNHEPYGQDEIPSANQTNLLNQYKIATGLDTVTDKMRSELYYEITAPNGDHHIYMALELVNNKYHPGISDNFTKAQIDWLEGLLNKYKNDGKKVFIYEHAPFGGYGAGDNKETPHYDAAMTIDKDLYPQTYRFKELLEANKNIVWFSGHTHIDFKYNYNIDNENGTTAYTVHVPSTASTATVNASGGLDYVGKADSAQGYFVDVYADATVINGTDLVENEILPKYTYLVDYSAEKVVNPEYKEETDNFSKVTVIVDASAISQNPDSVKVTLFGAEDEADTSTITMAKGVDGTYTAQVSTKYTKMRFVIKNGSAEVKSSDYEVANCKVVLGGLKIAVKLSAIKTKENGSCTSWANVNAYAWNKSSNANCSGWPGTAMTKEADGSYSVLLPVEVNPDMVIFNNGTSQTADLSITLYIVSSVKGSYTVDSSITPPATEEPVPTEAPVPVETIRIYLNKPTSWADALIYGFYGVEGGTATGEPLGEYPGTKMTKLEGNVYYYDVPEDIDYIKFVDGTNTSRRTSNFPNSKLSDNIIFNLTISGDKWAGTATPYAAKSASVASVGATHLYYGDADQNNAVNVKDATAIQKHLADIIKLSEYGYMVSDVDADGNVNIKDATTIQKLVASIIKEFPSGMDLIIEEPTTTSTEATDPTVTEKTDPTEESKPTEKTDPTETEATDPTVTEETDPTETTSEVVAGDPTQLNNLLATVKKTLADESYYASYVAYAGLKKAYYNYKDANKAAMSEEALAAAVAEINEALSDYNTMKKNNPSHVGAYVAPTAGSYVIHGNFTGTWADLELTGTGTVATATVSIEAGSYEFVMNKVGTDEWLKNGTTINDTCSNLKYSTSQTGNTIFKATGGTYTFSFNTSTKALTITKK